MPITLDVSQLSLEQAANLLATQVGISCIRSGREKTAISGMQAALLGGGVGLGTGLMSSALSTDDRKRWLRNALLGSALGAGVGGAMGYGADALKTIRNTTPIEAGQNAAAAAVAAEQNKPTDAVTNVLRQVMTGQTPEQVAAAAAAAAQPTAPAPAAPVASQSATDAAGYGVAKTPEELPNYKGGPITPAPSDATAAIIKDMYGNNLPTTAASAGAGGVIGGVADWARRRHITPDVVNNIDDGQLKRLGSTWQRKVTEFNDASTAAREAGGVVRKPLFGGTPTFETPAAGPSVPRGMGAGAMPGSPASPVTHVPPTNVKQFPANVWHGDIKPAMRKVAPHKWGGTLTGGGIGAAAAPLVNNAVSNWQSWLNRPE